MIEELSEYVKTILSFVLFLRVISLLFPDSSYEKYVRPVGMLLLVILTMKPLLGNTFDPGKVVADIKQEFLLQNEIAGIMPEYEDGGYKAALLTEYRERLKGQLGEYLQGVGYAVKKVQFVLAEETDCFGTIQGVFVVLVPEEKERNTKIEQIRVLLTGKKETENVGKTAEELWVSERLSEFYGLKKEQVEVTIGEE